MNPSSELCNKAYPDDKGMGVSHETIDKNLFVKTRGLLRKMLGNHLEDNANPGMSKTISLDRGNRYPRGHPFEIDPQTLKIALCQGIGRAV